MKIAKSILESLQQPVLVLDVTLRPLIANPAFLQMFELSPTEVEGKFVSELINGEICDPSLRMIIESILTNDSNEDGIETVCRMREGERIHLHVNARRINESDLPEMILLELRNITKEKEAELKIQEMNDALQKHAAYVDAVNEELESYSHSVSHDLRTPLRFVNRIAHVLLHDPGTNLSDVAIQQINMILQATMEMGRLIETLLIFSQVDREPIKKRRLDLRSLFLKTIKEQENAELIRDVEIDIQDIAPCRGDRTLLKEVASNLLTNALKFTRKKEKAKITIGCMKTADETIYFVQDNGIGFNMSNSDSLFLPFQKLHKAEEFEGTGIGLALVKRIIERHGGRIWAEGEVNKGAVFYFTLGK
ncbi:MAG: sensor histidine kinase [Candidatus Hinthialibacter sp.]